MTGTLDPDFRTRRTGKVTTDFNGQNDLIKSIKIDANGKIVVGGYKTNLNNTRDFALARYSSDGSLDKSFGSGGTVTTDFVGKNDEINSIGIDLNGKIVVGGYATNSYNTTDFVLARYTSSGSVDTTFGTQTGSGTRTGKVITDFNGGDDSINSIIIDPVYGNIIVGGNSLGGTKGDDFALAVYSPFGDLYTSFGSGGTVITDFNGGNDLIKSIVMDTTGRIVVGGNGSGNDFALARYTISGTVDTTFGSGGTVITDFYGETDSINSIAIDANGNIVVGGYAAFPDNTTNIFDNPRDFALARYTSGGNLDTTFGSEGKVTTDFNGKIDLINSIAIDGSNNIVVGGYKMNADNTTDFALARYTSGGILDTTFGSEGKVITDFNGKTDLINSIVIDANGKIVVGGAKTNSDDTSDFALARYTSNGILDTTFGEKNFIMKKISGNLDLTFGSDGTGKVITDLNGKTDIIKSIAIDANGKIVVGGYEINSDGSGNDFALARYTSGGILDATFGSGGKVITDFNGDHDEINSIAIDVNGNIVVGGYQEDVNDYENFDFALARYKPNGILDTTFGSGGKVITNFPPKSSLIYSIAIDSNGKIVVGGIISIPAFTNNACLARYNSNGNLDTTFGSGGKVQIGFPGMFNSLYSIVIDTNGNIVVGGIQINVSTISDAINNNSNFFLARYTSGGSVDTTFGLGGTGIVTTDFVGKPDSINSIAIDLNGNIVVGGYATNSNNTTDFALARYTSGGNVDTTFGPPGSGGKLTTDFNSRNDRIQSIVIDENNNIVVGGYTTNSNNTDFALARYTSGGILDTTFGSEGKIITDFTGDDRINSIVIDSHGKIVVGGISGNDFALARYFGDDDYQNKFIMKINGGTLDRTFGSDGTGKVMTYFNLSGILSTSINPNPDDFYISSIAIDSTGKIVVGGYSLVSGFGGYTLFVFILSRYTSDGNLDLSFGSNGKGFVYKQFSIYSILFSMVIDRNNNIVVGGFSGSDFALARYTSGGELDDTFGEVNTSGNRKGFVTTDFNGGIDSINSIAIDTIGNIVVGGNSGTDFALARYTSNGDLDPNFGLGGKITTDFNGGTDEINSIAIDRNNNIVVGGFTTNLDNNTDFALARYKFADGELDTNFNYDSYGKITTDFNGGIDAINSIVIDANDKIVVGGISDNDFALARYTSDGNLDRSFGLDGKVITNFNGGIDQINSIKINANGKIFVGGTSDKDFALACYTSDGVLDTTFGSRGKVTTDFNGRNDRINSIALDANGNIVVGGVTDNISFASDAFSNTAGESNNFALARYFGETQYLKTGDLDVTFGLGGKVITDFSFNNVVGNNDDLYKNSIAIDSNGGTIVGGTNGTDFALARYNSYGIIDASFGLVTTDFNGGIDRINSIVIDVNGNIVVGGTNGNDFALARYNSNGIIDASFGKVTTDFDGGTDVINSIAVDGNNGKIVVGGTNGSDFALARYNSNGDLDTSFGIDGTGKVTTDFNEGNDRINSIAIDANGKIVVGGYKSYINNFTIDRDFALARYTSSGILDDSFGPPGSGGKVTTDFNGNFNEINSIAIDANGKIVVGGFKVINNYSRLFVLARYTSSGILDTTFGTGGEVTTDFNSGKNKIMSILINNFGNIIVGGYATDYNLAESYFALAFYNKNGSLDTTIGSNGKVTTDFSSLNTDIINSMAFDIDGNIVVGGSISNTASGSNYGGKFVLARYFGYNTFKQKLDYDFNVVYSDIPLLRNTDYNYDLSGNRVFIEFINPDASYNFSFSKQVEIDILVVGGGGAGGFTDKHYAYGGGGGAGGVTMQNINNILANTTYSASVGSGGISPENNANGSNFNNTYYANKGNIGGFLNRPLFYPSGGQSGNGFIGGIFPPQAFDTGVATFSGGGGGAGGIGNIEYLGEALENITTGANPYGGDGLLWPINGIHYGFGGSGIKSGGNIFIKTYNPPILKSTYGNGGAGAKLISAGIMNGDLGKSGAVIISYKTLTNFPDIIKTYGDASFNLNPTSLSPGTFTFTSSNLAVATISGNTVTILAAGTTTIKATHTRQTKNSSGNYFGGTIDATLTVEKAFPTIERIDIVENFRGFFTIVLNPVSNSPGSFSFTSSDPAVATISGNTNIVTINGVGSPTINIIQQETDNFTQGLQFGQITITKGYPTITFNDFTVNYGQPPFNLLAFVSSTNTTGTFRFTNINSSFSSLTMPNNDSFDQSVADISGNIVTLLKPGITAIRAIQAETPYFRSSYRDMFLTVAKEYPTIQNFQDINETYGNIPFNLTNPSSNSTGTFRFTSLNPSVATISGSTVTIVGSGTATIRATQAEYGNYVEGYLDASLNVAKANPTIQNFPTINETYGNIPFNLTNPISNSTGTFSYRSSNSSVADISGNTVTIVGSGNTTITANQDASGNYFSGYLDASLNVAKATPTIQNLPTINKTYGNIPFNLTDPSSNSPGTFRYSSSNSSFATIIGSTVTIVGSGNATITATQSESSNFLSGSLDINLSVAQANPTITNLQDINKIYGDIPFDLNASSNSTGIIRYRISNSSVADISGNTVTIVGSGNTTITATQDASGNYFSGTIDASLNVAKGEPTISFLINLNKNLSESTFTLDPISNSTGTFSFTSSDPLVATINGNIVTMLTAGTTTIRATQAESNLYLSKFIDTSFTVVETPAATTSSVTLGDTKVSVFTLGKDSVFAVAPPKSVEGSSIPLSTVTSIRVGTTIYTIMT
jgi:uncharacterized delta-60 repeat protein